MDKVVVFIISLFLGSFYNVLAIRTLNKESITLGRSHCTTCNHKLNILDMIPVLSYVILKGRCRYCGSKISRVYPFGEILTSIAYTSIFIKFGYSFLSIINITFITFLILGSITDIVYFIMPNRFILIGIIFTTLLNMIDSLDIKDSIINGFLSFLLLYIIYVLSNNGLGGADVKVYGLIGLSIGFIGAINSLFFASILGVFIFLTIYLIYGSIEGRKIPFIPLITIGVILTYHINIINI